MYCTENHYIDSLLVKADLCIYKESNLKLNDIKKNMLAFKLKDMHNQQV